MSSVRTATGPRVASSSTKEPLESRNGELSQLQDRRLRLPDVVHNSMKTASADRSLHPSKQVSKRRKQASPRSRRGLLQLPGDNSEADVQVGGRTVHLTNLDKLFWPELGIT